MGYMYKEELVHKMYMYSKLVFINLLISYLSQSDLVHSAGKSYLYVEALKAHIGSYIKRDNLLKPVGTVKLLYFTVTGLIGRVFWLLYKFL